ncbi:ankyrin repeat-containing domain protein [Neocallimastix lanati (nom. inval.)]|nr:ankyrin repeat-containing domain protein [Neocallimastix sp. JGI-2020a]
MNNLVNMRDTKFEEYNDNKNTDLIKENKIKLKYIKSEDNLAYGFTKYLIGFELECQVIIINKKFKYKEIKKFFNISKFYDNEFIKLLLFLYKNKTPTKNLNYEISKEKYKIILNWDKWDDFSWIDTYIIGYGNINLFKLLLRHGVDINKIFYEDREAPLFDACESVNIDLIEFLVENGADINKENNVGETPLFYVCESGNKDLAEYLKNNDSETPLFKASQSVEHGAVINNETKCIRETPLLNTCRKTEDGETPLFYGCEIEHGADINKENEDSKTPLFKAIESGNKELIEYLTEHGADINKENEDGKTPLFYVCESGNKDLVKYLVEKGADINKENRYGETPLFNACESGNKSLVKYLVEDGANINKENEKDETPLFYACELEENDLVEILVEKGADINKESRYGETPLFNACIIEHGAEINKESKWNRETPLFNACKRGKENLIEYLVQHGADINKTNIYGQKPLFYLIHRKKL